MIRIISLVFTMILTTLALSDHARAAEYQLHAQDELRLRVLRWDGDRNAFTVLDGVSGEYRISTDGVLSMPLIGSISAIGQTAPGIGASNRVRNRAQTGHFACPTRWHRSDRPPANLCVGRGHGTRCVRLSARFDGATGFGPVQRLDPPASGQCGARLHRTQCAWEERSAALRPKLTPSRQSVPDWSRIWTIWIARRTAPPPLSARARVALRGDILEATQNARASQADRLRDLQAVLREQIERMTAQITLRSEQIARTTAELDDVTSLKQRGLTVNTRVNALTTALNDLESKRLQLEIARLTARQQLNRAERDTLALTDDARASTLEQLNRVDRDLARLDIRLATSEALRAQAVASGLAVPDPLTEEQTEYRVTRVVDGAPVSLIIAPTDPLMPGDTIEVSRSASLSTNSQ